MKTLITGAAGSIGSNLVQALDKLGYALIVLDNSEYGLSLMEETVSERVVLALGDVRDRERLRSLLRGVDVVVHAAAYKRVEFGEANMPEVIKVNVQGALNVVEMCLEADVKKALLVSSDKAVPFDDMSIYGVTKLLQEKTFLLANDARCAFSVARFGNVIGTRGDVTEIWNNQHSRGKPLSITDKKMSRFFWTMSEATAFIIKCLNCMCGGEIFVPKLQERNIMDYAASLYGKDFRFEMTGLRSGEVLNHVLMTNGEKNCAEDLDWCFAVRRVMPK